MGKTADDFTVPTIEYPDHERTDAQIRPLALFLAGLVSSLLFVGLIVWLLFDVFFATINTSAADSRPAPVQRDDTNQPLLQVSPRLNMEEFRAHEERVLNSAEWIDRNKGIARIPIAAAMEQVVSNGLPKWPPVVEQPAGTPTASSGSATAPTNNRSPQNNSNPATK